LARLDGNSFVKTGVLPEIERDEPEKFTSLTRSLKNSSGKWPVKSQKIGLVYANQTIFSFWLQTDKEKNLV
jgi:hypothetical protein